MSRKILFIVSIIPILLIGWSSAPIAPQAAGPEGQALKLVSERTGVPLKLLKVENSASVDYQLLGEKTFVYKIVNKLDSSVYGITLNAAGLEVDSERLMEDEQAAYTSRFGRVDPLLVERLASAAEGEEIEVVIWLKDSSPEDGHKRPDPDAKLSQEELDAYYAEVDAQGVSRFADLTAFVVDKLINMGYKGVASDGFAPVVYATLTSEAIWEVGMWDEVDTVYFAPINEPDLEIARATIFANQVHSSGNIATGIKIGEIEVGGRIATSNPYLAGVVQNTTYSCLSGHSTAVAGIIRSTHSTRKGIAPGASLWVGGSCGGVTSQLQNRSTAANTWGARVLNLSWGSNIGLVPGANDRFYDNWAPNYDRLVIKSAGNRGSGCGYEGNVTSPGLGYNVLTVGNFDDKNTTSWTGDTMSSCSSWRDPTSSNGDREKPEVAAPGTNFNSTTNSSPWTGAVGSGTSYSAPMVTGTAALLMKRHTSLTYWPEPLKAILMAAANHNIEGAARLSEYDGAGGINAKAADLVAQNNTSYGRWGGIAYSCTTASPYYVNMPLVAGKVTRVVVVWNQNPAYTGYASRPSVDIDMRVLNPSGVSVASSTSFDNTYEIVRFTPTVTGTYKIRIYRSGTCHLTPKYMGWAWYHP